ncbi:MAG: hypothetical protein KDD14_21830 [Saprospiraceae bacterium]|nr:hypothetical protein [Saprospiraceae bacterium]
MRTAPGSIRLQTSPAQFFAFLVGLLLLSTPDFLMAQCPPDLWFDSQAEVDAFPATYPTCKNMIGPVLVVGTDITNLDSLRQLRSIGNKLQIESPNLADISGLTGLTRVDGFLHIGGTALTNLHGLENLKLTGSSFTVANNAMMLTTTQFDSLQHSGFSISGSPLLQDFGTFPSLQTGKNIHLNNPASQISNLEGVFPKLETAEYFFLENIPQLESLNGLHSLNRVGAMSIKKTGIADLTGLENLQIISTYLYLFENPELLNLTGMAALDSVQSLQITGNPKFAGLQGLEQMNHVAQLEISENESLQTLADSAALPNVIGVLNITRNPNLTSLRGLENLHVQNGVTIEDNETLLTLEGLAKVQHPYNVSIKGNPQLRDLAGLQQLETVTVLVLENNDALTDLSGLSSLRAARQLRVNDHLRLKNLHGLESLESFQTGVLYILRNDSLTTLEGLGAMLGTQSILIKDNPLLSGCSTLPVCNALALNAFPTLENNQTGCNTPAEILATCNFSFNSLGGQVFLDPECDGVAGIQDRFLPYQMLRTTDGRPFAFTDANGRYQRFLTGSQQFNFRADAMPGFSPQPDSISISTNDTLKLFSGQDFALCPDSLFNNWRVSISPIGLPRPGFENRYVIQYQNRSAQPGSAALRLDFLDDVHPDFLTITSANGGTSTGTNQLQWNLVNFPIFSTTAKFEVRVKLDATTPLGAILQPRVRIVPANGDDIDWSDNEMTLPQTVVGSFDPNDKWVDREQLSHPVASEGEWLRYLVRFQNTGTAAAEIVELRDTLPAELDFNTFQPLTASHRYKLSFPENGVLNWRFENINLPDSASNEPQSHGFVQFRIRSYPGLNVGDSIRNRAGIYFDFNPVVLTNYAVSRVTEMVPAPIVQSPAPLALRILPNPFSDHFWIEIPGIEPHPKQPMILEIADLTGRILLRQNVAGSRFMLNRDRLPAGLLLFWLRDSSGAVLACGRGVAR